MEGALSELAEHLDDILPKDAQFVLDWNPPQIRTESEADVIFHNQEPPDTAPSALRTTTIGSPCHCKIPIVEGNLTARLAAFYDRHLAPHLILESVVYFDTLVSTMANMVDQAIQDAVTKRPLPKDTGMLLPENLIKHQVRSLFRRTKYREMGVVESYLKHAAMYCLPIASTLAIYPSSEHWDSILNWTTDGTIGRWAIADGVLLISPNVFADDQWEQQLLQNEDNGKEGILEQLAFQSTALAVWVMKSLTVGTARVMEEIVEMGVTHAKFPWKTCTPSVCKHRFWECMEESRENYDTGFDARSPPWTLPIISSAFVADSQTASLRKGLRSASVQSGTTAGPSYKELSMSPVDDGEDVRKKRRCD